MRCAMAWALLLAVLGCGAGGHNWRDVTPARKSRPAEKSASELIPSGAEVPKKQASSAARKLISTARIELVVEDFEKIPDEVETLAKQFNGFVAQSSVSGSPGRPRRGQWTLRVPAERFDEFLVAVRHMGEIDTISSEAKDITEEYSDLEVRLRNKKQEETRLLKLLADSTGKLKDVLDVEKELSRVRTEAEQLEGRIRLLNDQTTLATVYLEVSERQDYTPREAARYRTRLGRALGESVHALVRTLDALSIFAIAVLPWLATFGLPILALWLLLRWRARRRK